ncbi:MAG: hypothetical protein JSR40_11100 [Proteobacteria bacterium]|nr:hypothetical protein [Pseudomonadota bacterium]
MRIQQARRLTVVRRPRRLTQAASNRLAIEIQSARDGRHALSARIQPMDLLPAFLGKHTCLLELTRHGHSSRGAADDVAPRGDIVEHFLPFHF